MTQDEFEAWYAQNSNITVATLHEMGLSAAPCDCGEPECKGWQMTHKPPHEHVWVADPYIRQYFCAICDVERIV